MSELSPDTKWSIRGVVLTFSDTFVSDWFSIRLFMEGGDKGSPQRGGNLTDKSCMGKEQDFLALMESAANFVIYRLAYDKTQPLLFNVVFVSPSIVDILGISEPMKYEMWFENIHKEDQKAVIRANADAVKTGKFAQTFRVYHPQKKEIRWMHAVSTSIRGQMLNPFM